MAIEVTPLPASFGATVRGLALASLDDEDFRRLYDHWLEYALLVFPGQHLDTARQVAFARRFGPLHVHPYVVPLDGHPEVIEVVKEAGDRGIFGGTWHSDLTYLEKPMMGAVLHALEVPAAGGDTLFANMYLAYESLSPGLRRLLDGLSAVNSAGKNKETLRDNHLASGAMACTAADPRGLEAEHPVVRRHPVTGRKALYVNRAHTLRFSDMTEAESAGLLGFLFEHAAREDFTCRFRWRVGSLALWDNRCTQHFAINDYDGQRRLMHRITLDGVALSA